MKTKTYLRTVAIVVLMMLVAVNAFPVLASGSEGGSPARTEPSALAGSVSGLDNLSLTVLQGWSFLDTNVSVTSSGNDWTGGYIDIAMTSGGSVSDQLRLLSSGSLSVVGDAVSWDGTRIGTIDPVRNGVNGQPLRINFSASLPNASFEDSFTGWTVNTNFPGLPGDTPTNITQTASVQSSVVYSGSYAAKLEITGNVVQSCGTAHGPELTSSTFYAKSGDALTVMWNAVQTGDYYDVYGYVRNSSTGVEQQLFYERGATTGGWKATNTSIDSTVCPSGTCGLQFRFLGGTYDYTCGNYVGSILYIDGVNVVTSTARDDAADYIVEHIEYQNTALESAGTKTYTVTLQDASALGSGSANITISKVASSTSITGISPEPTSYGQNYNVSVQVTSAVATPPGSVTVSDGLGNSCSATLSGGVGSCALPSWSLGSRTITANYPGTTAGLYASSATSSHSVTKANTSISISDSPDPSVYMQNYTVSVTVNPAYSGTPTGTVSVGDGTNSCSATLSGGSGSCTLPSTQVASKTITASYPGDANFNGSSNTASHTINKAPTTTTITADNPDPSVYGETVMFDVSVAGAYGGVPGGTVTVRNGSTTLCTATLSGATGSCGYDLLAAGNYTNLNAVYNGDGEFLTSISGNYSHYVDKASTTTVMEPSVASPVYGQQINFSATVTPVAPGAQIPNGTVDFYVDGTLLSTNPLDASGVATSANIHTLTAGSHAFYAVYSGSSNYYGSNSMAAATELTVQKNTTTAAVISAVPTSVYAQEFTLTATITQDAPSLITPVGQVQFFFDGAPIGSPVDLSGGSATSPEVLSLLGYTYPLVGTHTFSVSYAGNSNTIGSDSGDMNQEVVPAPTTVFINSSENPTVYGTSLDITITIDADDPSLATPAGKVQLYLDGIKFGTELTLDAAGKAVRQIPYVNLWPGEHLLTATFTPAAPEQFEASASLTPYSQIVYKANPIFSILPSVENPVSGEPVTYTVTVSPSMPTQGTPSGTVQFYVDGVASGSPVMLNAEGKATSPLAIQLPAGDHTISISYSGDDYFYSAPMTPLLSESIAKGDPIVSIVNFSPETAVVGQPVTVNVQVQPESPATGIPSGTVQVSNGTNSCTVTLNASGAGSCELTPTAPGTPALTAEYSGDANFNAGSSGPVAGPEVNKADAVVSLTSFSPTNPVVGQPVNIYFTVLPVAPGNGTPTGSVTIDDGNGHTCTADITVGFCALTFEAAGPTQLSASYAGDSNFNPYQTSSPLTGPVIEKASTSLGVVSSASTSVYGQPVHFTATISVTAPGSGAPTGFIQFKVDGANLGEPVALFGGSAVSIDVSSLAVGAHTFSATYLGDANFAQSSTTDQAQTVGKAFTSIALVSSLNPSPYGIPVLVTATVSANLPSLATPNSGTVQFIVDGVNYGAPVPIDSTGHATKLLPYTALWVGVHNITAIYSGSANFFGSDNLTSPLSQVVELGTLTITLVPSVEDPVFGQSFTFSTTVIPTGGSVPNPTGTVQFKVDGENLGSVVTLDGSSKAVSIPVGNLAVGTHSATVVYSGDDYYRPTTVEIAAAVSVGKAASLPTITGFDPTTVVVGQPVTVNFKVEAVLPGAGVPSGEVTISNGSQTCTGTLAGDGTGSCSLIPTGAGAPDLNISYAGDASFLGSTAPAPTAGPTVNPADSTVVITGFNPASLVYGQPLTITFAVTANAPSTLTPGGTVTINGGGTSCSAVVAVDGTGSCVLTPTAPGAVTFTASYAGNANFNPSTSAPESGPFVDKAGTSVALTSSINPSLASGSVQFTVNMQVLAPGSGVPTGMVQFAVDGVDQGASVALVNGVAVSPAITTLSLGSHTITAAYAGDSNFEASTSAPYTQMVMDADAGAAVQPGTSTQIVSVTRVGNVDVTATIDIPAGAVSGKTTLLFTWMNVSTHEPPSGEKYVLLFKLEAYVDGVLQSNFQFLQPVSINLIYNPLYWNEDSLMPNVWTGSAWSRSGLVVTDRDPNFDNLTFSLTNLGESEFALSGTAKFVYAMPIVSK